jgi:YD repeat-containing protein
VAVVTDAKGNQVRYEKPDGSSGYDANSNVVSMIEVEKSDLGGPDEFFVTEFEYDGLDRLNKTTDNAGNVNENWYDSRNNLTLTIDALGHQVRRKYDGLNRLVETVRYMAENSVAETCVAPNPDDIVTGQEWDANSRLAAQIDDNGNATRYAYDALNRRIVTQMADGTFHQVGSGAGWAKGAPAPDLTGFTSGYDEHDNALLTTDANGSVVTAVHDLLNRVISKTITPGAGVAEAANGGTTLETYEYDGLSRMVQAQDNDSLVKREYDSMSNIVKEVQNQSPPGFDSADDRVVLSAYDGVGNKLRCTYPGGREITITYDPLDRKKTITDTTPSPSPFKGEGRGEGFARGTTGLIATYDFVGPGRVQRRTYNANGTRCDYDYDGVSLVPGGPVNNDMGDFGVKRITRTRHTVAGVTCASDIDCPTGTTCQTATSTCIVDDRTYTWDRMFNKTQRKDVRPGGPQLTHDYEYDNAYRLVHTVVNDDSGGPPLRDTVYKLDGVHNREEVIGAPDAGPYVGSYTLDGTQAEPADCQVNQYTATPMDSRTYDLNGNLTGIVETGADTIAILYDYRNQMVRYTNVTAGVYHTYSYDPLGRRIRKIVNLPLTAASDATDPNSLFAIRHSPFRGSPVETRFFYNESWQILEEQVASTTALRADLGDMLYTFTGMPNAALGGSVSAAGDVNNDGYDDLIVGAFLAGADHGQAYVFSGQDGSLLYTFTGEADGDEFGWSVSEAGDVNNDGYDDVIVGAPQNDAGGGNAGRVYVYSGQNGALLHTFTGQTTGSERLGWSVSGAGDVNNDGFDDVIVGAPQNDAGANNAGRAYLYSGQNGAVLHTFTGQASGEQLGWSVSGAGDVNNDGFADLIVGTNDVNVPGTARVYSGQNGAELHTFIGEVKDDAFGYSVSGAGDVNNDGFADVIIGAIHAGGGRGRAYVYRGDTGAVLYMFTGEALSDQLGYSVSAAGDLNNDGFGDLIVGAPFNDAGGGNAGRAYLYSGQNGLLLHSFTGEAAGDQFGNCVSGAGDVNHDGTPDVIVGASLNDAGGSDAGRAYVYAGQTFAPQGATYVDGLYIDEHLQMRRLSPSPLQGEGKGEGAYPSPYEGEGQGEGAPAVPPSLRAFVPMDFYYHTDDLYSTMALTDSNGNVLERYEYQDYGQPEVLPP